MPPGVYPRPSLQERLEARLDKLSSPHGCWLWTGAQGRTGGGLPISYMHGADGKMQSAARVAWTVALWPDP